MIENMLAPMVPWVYIVLCIGAMLPPAVAAAKAIISLFFLRVSVYRQGFTGAPRYEYMMRGK